MSLADWDIYTLPTGDLRTLELRSDKVIEGSKALFIDADETYLIHKQTETDAPVSGAVKTYFLFQQGVYSLAGAVFKADLAGNALAIYVYEPGYFEIFHYVNGNGNSIDHGSLNITFSEDTWYIFEIICDSENDQITIRVKDVDENILAETIRSNIIPPDIINVGGAIGLFAWSSGVYYDLTKIYYP